MAGGWMVLVGQGDETGLVGRVVLDALGEDLHVVDLGGALGTDGCGRGPAGLHVDHRGHGAQRRFPGDGGKVCAQVIPALGEGLGMRVDYLHRFRGHAGRSDQIVVDGDHYFVSD